MISSKLVKEEQVVFVLPKDKKIQAFFDMKKTTNKERYPIILWNAELATTMESKHTPQHSNVEKSIRIKIESDMEQ